MSEITRNSVREAIGAELESTRLSFHALLNSLPEQDLQKKSLNPGWTNGEILFHMTFAFMLLASLIPMVLFWGRLPKGYSKIFAWILNSFTGFFNWINALGARGGGRIYRKEGIGTKFDKIHFFLLRRLSSIREHEWQRGMYYPAKWDALFSEYMTLEDIFHYPVKHFKFHLNQISH